ncbi:MAG: VWA domain-containing protein [Candidatus Dormibacteraeota bacterium]|nr:VWA domain-containing protein [Candidatus Dormibacteraeota bacterium]
MAEGDSGGWRFLDPPWLWLLVAVAALLAAYVLRQLLRRRYVVRFSNLSVLRSVAPHHPGWRRHVTFALLLCSLSALVVAMARPAAMVRTPQQNATVIVAIDVSLSMQATDITPTRLRAEQSAASSFVNGLPPGYKVGLVSFAGSASLLVPPTTNHDVVVEGIGQLQLAESTAIGEGIYTSLGAIEQARAGRGSAAIVLLSDGKTNEGRSNDEASAAAKQQDVPVSTVALGTDSGQVTINGDTEPVPVDRQALKQIADQTGGEYFAGTSAGQLQAAYEHLKTTVSYTYQPREVTMVFVGVGLLLSFLASAAALFWRTSIP